MKLLLKNTFKKIKNSFGRFLSITFIIALGISVFIGLRESTAGMLYTADDYYDKTKLMDFKIISTHGLTKEDIKSINELTNSDKVIPSYSIDVLINGDSVRIHALEKEVNNLVLKKGRLPKDNSECVGEHNKYKIGDILNFEKEDLNDFLNLEKCTIVGLANSPLYIRYEKGISNMGNGKLSSFLFINKDNFKMDYYTESYIISKDSVEKNSYYDDYTDNINLLKIELEKLKPIRETIRYEELLKEGNEEIAKNKRELDEKIIEAEKKLKNAKNKLDSSTKELNNKKNETLEIFEKNKIELKNNEEQIISNLTSQNIKESELNTFITNLYSNIDTLNKKLLLIPIDTPEHAQLSKQIKELENQYNSLLFIQNSLIEIKKNKEILDKSYDEFIKELDKNESELKQGYYEYYKNVDALDTTKIEAEEKIKEAIEKLNTLEKPKWYLLDRSDNNGYTAYKEDIIKVEAIAKVLPVFFILIVILMILNTLTRLIEEERTEIGILQANGFSVSVIIFSYLVYVITAGIIGISIGLTIGYNLIPPIIYGTFLATYYVPKLITIVSPIPFTLVIVITLIIMILVTIFACKKELKEHPAYLLRTKPIKAGKNIFLERIDFIWKKLNFITKTTIRNIFRNKKRVFMTIIGVAGCTALLVTGFGINDSINTISKLQYNNIIKYDGIYVLKDNTKSISKEIIKLFNDNGIVNPILVNQNSYKFSYDGKSEDVYLVVPADTTSFNNYVSIKDTKTKKNINIKDNGVIITRQMAELLNVKPKDKIGIRNSDNELFYLYVTDIVENYVSHYIYMSSSYYEEVLNKTIDFNSIIANGKLDSKVKISDYGFITITYIDEIIKTFDDLVKSLNQIIIMIIVFACFLAFIVLYNLTIINVSERKREIATLKVLGFFDKEVYKFIYTETFILTLIGTILGLFFGIYLHDFVMKTAETDNIVFLRYIKDTSFLFSGIITLFFSLIVQLIINKSIKKIDMIDSLKSIE